MSDFHHPQPLTADQIALLERVKPRILAEAEAFDMSTFFNITPTCNTPACIAGHIVAMVAPATLNLDRGDRWDIEEKMVEVSFTALGVDPEYDEDKEDIRPPLFYMDLWDADLSEEYEDGVGSEDLRANVAIKAIDRYIANTKAHFAEAQT